MKIWVSLMTDGVADLLMSGLVRRKFSVRPLGNNDVCIQKPFSTLVAMKVDWTGKKEDSPTASKAADTIADILKGYFYYAIIVVHEDGSSSWRGSNIMSDVLES